MGCLVLISNSFWEIIRESPRLMFVLATCARLRYLQCHFGVYETRASRDGVAHILIHYHTKSNLYYPP
jgi:hypothetical protein